MSLLHDLVALTWLSDQMGCTVGDISNPHIISLHIYFLSKQIFCCWISTHSIFGGTCLIILVLSAFWFPSPLR